MPHFIHLIHRANIKHFRSLLETESDGTKREIILKLLAEEEATAADSSLHHLAARAS